MKVCRSTLNALKLYIKFDIWVFSFCARLQGGGSRTCFASTSISLFTVKNSWRLSNRTIRRRLSHLADRFFWCCCDQRLWFGLFRLGPPYYAYVVLDMTMTATLFVNRRIKWETITILIANVWSTMRLFAKNLVPALTEVWSTSISWTAGPILIELCGQLNYH